MSKIYNKSINRWFDLDVRIDNIHSLDYNLSKINILLKMKCFDFFRYWMSGLKKLEGASFGYY